ncbi:biotin synthase [Cenarchaeum symbiosum A]|uniref:Biotin synthase n=1 Tax=Cenarchaeum symbiosum (strain A) TaxID=414004 RepID=BIOB_CENSY|nr:RecName: Full=Biotin synthase [Cenarchaeum symbiosum A]ABK77613.1 biotin synthase [Cenarchaeum symbiosum A]
MGIAECRDKVLGGGELTKDEARGLMEADVTELAAAADEITRRFNGDGVDVEQLNNIKRDGCSEDCTFCGQSAFYDADKEPHPLPEPEEVVRAALKAKKEEASSYCLVAAWREPTPEGFEKVCTIIQEINTHVGISVECSLGFLTRERAARLKGLGVKRYNHNLETARSKFPEICSTHTYEDRLDTLEIAREAGLELCTGGIIGMGESRGQRIELAMELARIRPEEATVNILVPVQGTPMELQAPLPPGEAERFFALVRFLLPRSVVKISGGREKALDDDGRAILRGGANGIITSGYLTMGGNDSSADMEMIREAGLEA